MIRKTINYIKENIVALIFIFCFLVAMVSIAKVRWQKKGKPWITTAWGKKF